jgi:hypothetical protein
MLLSSNLAQGRSSILLFQVLFNGEIRFAGFLTFIFYIKGKSFQKLVANQSL